MGCAQWLVGSFFSDQWSVISILCSVISEQKKSKLEFGTRNLEFGAWNLILRTSKLLTRTSHLQFFHK